MRQYVIDEIRFGDYEKIKDYLEKNFGPSEMGSIYWIPLDKDIYNDRQKEHEDCQPFYFAIDLEEDRISCELLVRTKKSMKCNCMAFADEQQRNWVIIFIDSIFERLGIIS